ncbi:MAG: hypothetical protein WC659_01135 [Patescibacteria group bacterium]
MSNFTIFGIGFIILIYLFALINRLIYLRRIYEIDINNQKLQGKSEIASIKTKMIRDGTVQYASEVAKGFVNETTRVANERIERRRY